MIAEVFWEDDMVAGSLLWPLTLFVMLVWAASKVGDALYKLFNKDK